MQEEQDQNSKDTVLSYLISLLDDANEFSCPTAKACHAVLLRQMEQGEIKDYMQVEIIDPIGRMHVQTLLTKSTAIEDCL